MTHTSNLPRLVSPFIIFLCLTATLNTPARADDSHIRLNTLGYLPDSPKRASIASPCDQFAVIRISNGKKAIEGKAGEPADNPDTGERLFTIDFSALQDPGDYYLEIPTVGRSPNFHIAPDLYNQPFHLVTRGMYLWRCGTAVTATHNGKTFHHEPCHTTDAWLDSVTQQHTQKDGAKGWHDAGDYNKYVVNAGVTVGCMLRAWEDFPAIRKLKLDLPESAGPIPEFLAEIKWETDWLLTMQADDGSVYHKVSTKRFGGFVRPESETAERFFTPWSSAATADFVAMLAMASRSFRPHDAPYADQLLAAAKKSYAFLKTHPENHNADLTGFSTGAYQTRDSDDRLWAAAELWEATGDPDALADVEARIKTINGKVDAVWDWGNVANLGLFTYALSPRPGRNEQLVQQVRANVIASADGIVKTRNNHGYARPLGSQYYWGCNGAVARQSLNLLIAHRFSPKPEYRQTALDALNHLFGRNVHGRSYVTGLGFRPPMNPHDRRSGSDTIDDPWPGYLVGGPHPKPAHWQDDQNDYRTNEIAINWNAALIYALAAFVQPPANK